MDLTPHYESATRHDGFSCFSLFLLAAKMGVNSHLHIINRGIEDYGEPPFPEGAL